MTETKVRKKGINSHKKGSEYELTVAKVLSSWWGEKFNRTPMSGGLHWGKDMRITGDITTPPTSKFPFSIECKNREDWTLEQLLKKDTKAEINKYWRQCCDDAIGVDLKPLLIFTRNFAPTYGIMYLTVYNIITQYLDMSVLNTMFIISPTEDDRVLFILDDFIKVVSKEHILKALNL